ncbi:MAG TPA: M81 family metallopeptidase [Daejeonella sp.]|uniref:M81 family metallopeptidase n=1 Tax=Daejeonella sp. TaxID=2805397 RepID=UPI002ED8EFBD
MTSDSSNNYTITPKSTLKRVAVLGIYHESNTFIDKRTTLIDFENGHLLKGSAILEEYKNAFHEIGGMLSVLEHQEIEIIPIMFAEATPGGMISATTYSTLTAMLMQELNRVLPIDGCLVIAHGAAVSEDFRDMDGHWLSMVRNKLGSEVPIIGTLDPHANASQMMINSTNALISYQTNPHVDQRATGITAANLLLDTLNKRIYPTQVLKQTQLAISIEQQNTSAEPCADLYRFVSTFKEHPSVLSISVMLGFPYADVEEMGTSFIIVTDDNQDMGVEIAKKLNSYLINKRNFYLGDKKEIQFYLDKIANDLKPVLLLDMGDNIGAGSSGNSTHLLEALENDGRYNSFICIYDPEAVAIASSYQKGDRFPFSFGTNQQGANFNTPEFTLLEIHNGQFEEDLPRHGGQVTYNMGKVMIGTTQNNNMIMLVSIRIAPFSLKQLTNFGITPSDFDVIIAKGVIAPVAAYSPVCPTIYQVNTPGVTQCDMTSFEYIHRRKPLFPFESSLN